jgi:hypothetical protein
MAPGPLGREQPLRASTVNRKISANTKHQNIVTFQLPAFCLIQCNALHLDKQSMNHSCVSHKGALSELQFRNQPKKIDKQEVFIIKIKHLPTSSRHSPML